MEEEIRKLILNKLGIFEKINTDLLNGRTSFIKKYSRLNRLVDIINTIYEETDIQKLKQMLDELDKLNKVHKLDDIRNLDIEKEITEEYVQEYNVTVTRYGKLSIEQLSKIDGIEKFEYKGKKFIVLNGVPFRFLGRTIMGNGTKKLTSPDFTEARFGSLISNIRPNRWASSSEFDIFEDLQSNNFVSFGAADAAKAIDAKEQIISPEILQRCVSSIGGAGFHTTIKFEGKRQAAASFINTEKAIDFEKCEEWVPYDTVYVLNEDVYSMQAQKRTAYFERLNQDETIEEFCKTANPEIIYDLISSSVEYYDNSCEISDNISNKKQRELLNWIEKINLEQCNDIENLRHIKAIVKILESIKSIHSDLLARLKEKCQSRIQEIAKKRDFSITNEIGECLEQIHKPNKHTSSEMMLDFINSEIERMKANGIFIVGESIKSKIINQDMVKEQKREVYSSNIEKNANKIQLRQRNIDDLYKMLELKNNQESMYEIAYRILEISIKVRNKETMSFEYAYQVARKILESQDYKDCIQECIQEQSDRFEVAIRNKVQNLIFDAKAKELEEQIESISNIKIGIIGRFLGKDKYYEAIRNDLSAQRSVLREKNIQTGYDIKELDRFIQENGMTQEIYDFLQRYYNNNLGISEEKKKNIEELLKIPIREKTSAPVEQLSLMEYRKKAKEIEKGTNEILNHNAGNNASKSIYSYKITSSKILKLREYINRVNALADQGMNIERGNEDPKNMDI